MKAQSHGSFTELEVWKKARTLKKELMKLVRRSPAEEKYRLSDQILRASRSINSDLAEGHGRYTFKDQIHFCIQARGSVSETLNHLIDAYDCGYMTREELKEYKQKMDEIARLLNGYMTYLREGINRPITNQPIN